MRIGITGQSGFLGTHLFNELKLHPNFTLVPFEDSFFESSSKMQSFVCECDVVVHLAAVNRHDDLNVLYSINVGLCQKLVDACELSKSNPHIIFSSSTQEELDNLYGKSKRDGREILEQWALRNGASFTGMIVPNVFGPFGLPNYNSFVATFCFKLTHGEIPQIIQDSSVSLVYVGSVCKFIISQIIQEKDAGSVMTNRVEVPSDFNRKVTEILDLLTEFKTLYFEQGFIPHLNSINDINLFNTFRSYINYKTHFPVKLTQHSDSRGVFVETIKLGVGGQVSFSTTLPGVTRGNHYHTRKIERFTVIKGKALIQLRKIGTDDVIDFYLDGNETSYVDMPIWYTHNIKNIGDDELYTQFWINEWYDSKDTDTYFENVT